MMFYTLSPNGLALIKRSEGCRLSAYQDIAGVWTIGYGTTTPVHYRAISAGMQIDSAMAEQLLQTTLITLEKQVSQVVTIPLKQNQYDALISLVYNIGIGNFRASTLLKKLNLGDIGGAEEQFLVWCKITDPKTRRKMTSVGLLNRRQEECALFNQ